MKQRFSTSSTIGLVLTLACVGCSSSLPTTKFVNPDFNFGFVERVAVLPLENLSQDQQSGVRATRLIMTELLASGAVDVVEPGEMLAALGKVAGGSRNPSTDEIIEIGSRLGVQALLMGSVAQSDTQRAGAVSIPTVTIDLHMVETETGSPIWAATHSESGGGFTAKLFGTAGEPISETTRRCVKALLQTLLQ